MSIETDIESAINRSISHNEIVRVSVPDIQAGRDAAGLIADECDDAVEGDGSLDVWGVLDGSDFRIRLVSLISAAPDLLNMLQRMVDEAATGSVCLLTQEHARNALTKATGGAR